MKITNVKNLSGVRSSTKSNHIGRPSSISEATVRRLELCFVQGLSNKTACELAHLPKTTFYYSMKHNEEFADRINFAKASLINIAGKRMLEIIKHGNNSDAGKLIKFVLERYESENWGRKRVPI
jgi:hypothetical protein